MERLRIRERQLPGSLTYCFEQAEVPAERVSVQRQSTEGLQDAGNCADARWRGKGAARA